MATYVGNALQAHAAGGCYICTRGDSLVDLGVDIVGEGALVLCKGCIAEAAEAAELTFNRARIRELEAENQSLNIEVLQARARELLFGQALEAVRPVTEPTVPALLAIPDPPERCAATTKAGAPCKGTPVAGTDRCMSHSSPA